MVSGMRRGVGADHRQVSGGGYDDDARNCDGIARLHSSYLLFEISLFGKRRLIVIDVIRGSYGRSIHNGPIQSFSPSCAHVSKWSLSKPRPPSSVETSKHAIRFSLQPAVVDSKHNMWAHMTRYGMHACFPAKRQAGWQAGWLASCVCGGVHVELWRLVT